MLLQININIDGVLPNYVIVSLLCSFYDHNYIFSVYRNLPKYYVKHQYYIGTNQILKYKIKIDIYHNERLNNSVNCHVRNKRHIVDRCFQIRYKRFFTNVIATFDLLKHKIWQEILLPRFLINVVFASNCRRNHTSISNGR